MTSLNAFALAWPRNKKPTMCELAEINSLRLQLSGNRVKAWTEEDFVKYVQFPSQIFVVVWRVNEINIIGKVVISFRIVFS